MNTGSQMERILRSKSAVRCATLCLCACFVMTLIASAGCQTTNGKRGCLFKNSCGGDDPVEARGQDAAMKQNTPPAPPAGDPLQPLGDGTGQQSSTGQQVGTVSQQIPQQQFYSNTAATGATAPMPDANAQAREYAQSVGSTLEPLQSPAASPAEYSAIANPQENAAPAPQRQYLSIGPSPLEAQNESATTSVAQSPSDSNSGLGFAPASGDHSALLPPELRGASSLYGFESGELDSFEPQAQNAETSGSGIAVPSFSALTNPASPIVPPVESLDDSTRIGQPLQGTQIRPMSATGDTVALKPTARAQVVMMQETGARADALSEQSAERAAMRPAQQQTAPAQTQAQPQNASQLRPSKHFPGLMVGGYVDGSAPRAVSRE